MRTSLKIASVSAALISANIAYATATINMLTGYLHDGSGDLINDGSTMLLVANLGTTGTTADWGSLAAGTAFSGSQTFAVGDTINTNFLIIARTTMDSATTTGYTGINEAPVSVDIAGLITSDGLAAGDRLGLIWFTLSSGATTGDWGFVSSTSTLGSTSGNPTFATPAANDIITVNFVDADCEMDYGGTATLDIGNSIQPSGQLWAVNPVPEPSHAALAFGLMAIGLVARRRRR